MTSSIRFGAALSAVLVSGLASAPALAGPVNLVENGGFESPIIGDGSFSVLPSIPGWTAIIGGIEVQRSVAGSPFEGAQHVELDAFGNSTMVQTIVTTPGEFYDFRLAYSPRPGVGLGDNGIEVFWDDIPIATLDADGTGLRDTDWNVFEFTDLVATRTSLIITIRAIGTSNALGGYIDDVFAAESQTSTTGSVPVPEPGTFTLLGLGVLGLGVLARRRRRQRRPSA